jgi:hypothetical protein
VVVALLDAGYLALSHPGGSRRRNDGLARLFHGL